MVHSCCAYGCTSRWDKRDAALTFHRIPAAEDIRKKWLIAIRRDNKWKPSKSSVICSNHFKETDFDQSGFRKRLLPTAVPSNFPEFPKHLKKRENNTRKYCDTVIATLSDEETTSGGEIREKTNSSTQTDLPPKEVDKVDKSTQVYQNDELEMGESPRKLVLSSKLLKTNNALLKARKKIKMLQQSNRRVIGYCRTLKDIIDHLKEKNKICSKQHHILTEGLSDSQKEVMLTIVDKRAKSPVSPAVRSFALTLHFYSPRAYFYVRKTFRNALPHPRTLKRWYSSINGEPGFTEEAFKAISLQASKSKEKGRQELIALMIDDMAIREHVEFDGQVMHGYVDLGTGLEGNDSMPHAKNALVFMAVGLTSSWKIPCGYFLIDSLDATERTNLIKQCLVKLYDTGAMTKSLTFDGVSTNLAIARQLGAELDVFSDQFNTQFIHPSDPNQKIHIILDACHMIKLTRNCLASMGILIDKDGNQVKWSHITALEQLQGEEGLRLANKLNKSHIQWDKKKMNVKLAAQLLSESVAIALEYCDTNLRLPNFIGATATAEYIRTFDKLFDAMNSRSPVGQFSKAPLKINNKAHWMKTFDDAVHYIRNLKDVNGKLILKSRIKTAFLGWLVNIKSTKELFNDCIDIQKYAQYLLTYKLSQDHLEIFFGCIRRHCGCNDNPTVRQFKSAYKKLLIHNEVQTVDTGNCINLTDISILCGVPQTVVAKSKLKSLSCTQQLDDCPAVHIPPEILGTYVENVVCYIAGFVVRSLFATIECQDCKSSLKHNERQSNNVNETAFSFIRKRSKGGLIEPSLDIVKICKAAETEYRSFKNDNDIIKKYNFILNAIPIKVTNQMHESVFQQLKSHVNNLDPLDNHICKLIKITTTLYLKIRLHHTVRMYNLNKNPKKIRNLCKKKIIFLHQ